MAENNRDVELKIFDRLGQIDGKLSNLENIRDRANTAFDIAKSAEAKALENEEDMIEFKSTMKWIIGVIISILIPVSLFVLGLVF